MPTPEARRRRAISLRSRLTAWVVAIFAAIQLVIGALFWVQERGALRTVFEERFEESARSIARQIEQGREPIEFDRLREIAVDLLGAVEFEQFDLDVVDGVGRGVALDRPRWPKTSRRVAEAALRSGRPQRARLGEDEVEVSLRQGTRSELIAIPIRRQGEPPAVLIAVTNDSYVKRQASLIGEILLVGGLLGLLASGLSGWFIAGIAVEPIKRLSHVAERLTPENIDQKLEPEGGSAEMAELTAQLEFARARIREAFAAQERFLSNISHEIKTPIATLLLEAQTINRAGLSPEAEAFVDSAEDEMRKLGKLVESFLTLTRVRDAGDLARLREYGANELVMDAVEDCRPMAEQYGVRLHAHLADDERGLSATVRGDPDLLRTMLNNLVRNAIRFTPRDSRVEIAADVHEGSFRIRVRDRGPGLPPELIDRVFDRFVQSSDEVRRERGHGLGLAIAKGIAELHDGDIGVRNVESGGAEFEATLPIAGGDDAPNEPLVDAAGRDAGQRSDANAGTAHDAAAE